MRSIPNDLIVDEHSSTNAALRCVLIHGTFARTAEWTKFDSTFSRLISQLSPGSTTMYRYLWSGENRQSARVDAANALGDMLIGESSKFPDSKFLLIGHSHGGNIAHRAALHLPESQRLGVVCLATPFFHARARSSALLFLLSLCVCGTLIASVLLAAVSILKLLAEVTLVIPIVTHISGSIEGWLMEKLPNLGTDYEVGVSIASLFFAWCWLSVGLARFVVGAVPYKQLTLRLRRWSVVNALEVDMLAIWLAPDEAYWFIRLTRAVVEIIQVLLGWITRYAVPASLVVWAFISGWAGISASREVTVLAMREHIGLVAFAIRFVEMQGVLAAVVLSCLLLAVAVAVVSAAISGADKYIDHVWLNIDVRRYPQFHGGKVTSIRMPIYGAGWFENVRMALTGRSSPLMHSRLYTDERVPREVVSWIGTLTQRLKG